MVSGFFTSPKDQERIFSGEASPMRMASKSSDFPGCLKRLNKSLKVSSPQNSAMLFVLLQLDVDTERADFLDQHVKGFRHARFHAMVTLDDVLEHLGAAGNVVGFHRQHFL